MTLAELVDAFKSAAGYEDIFSLLKATDPPTDPIDQQLVRRALVDPLKRWKIPLSAVDAWFKAKAQEHAERGILFPEYEPWADAVDGAELLGDLEEYFHRFVHAPAESILAASLWSLWTHSYELFDVAPLLVLTSPTKRCGKTTMLKLVGSVASRRLFSSNLTGAVLFRVIEKYSPTLLIDEADNFAKFNDELKGLLNAGHERMTATATRTVGDQFEVRTFSTWSPKAFTSIGQLPDTIDDRSIRIVMLRKPQGLKKDHARRRAIEAAATPLIRRMARWAEDNAVALRAADEPELEAIHDRAADNWAPLLVIADLCGARGRAEAAAVTLTSGEEAGIDELLLAHVREAFGTADRIATTDLLRALVDRDDGPWAKWWASDIDDPDRRKKAAAGLARRLRRFDSNLKATRAQSGGERDRGYDRAQFEDLWRRWVAAEDTAPPGPGNLGHLGHLGQEVPAIQPLTSANVGVDKVPKVDKVPGPAGSVGPDDIKGRS